jgi:tetratricopeptide (TPR) repeat protein
MSRSVMLLFAVLLAAAPLLGQGRPFPSQSPMIQGNVRLSNGDPAPFILLTLEPENGGGFLESATTDSAGFFSFSNILVGTNYTIVINANGFKTIHRLVMVTAYLTQEDFTLEPASGGGEPNAGAVVSVENLEIPPKALEQFRKGVGQMEAGDNAAAEASFREAIRIFPRYAAGYRRLSAACANLGRFPEADTAIQHALRLDRKSHQSYAYLGYVYEKEKQIGKAEKAFQESIRLSNADWFAHLELGRIFYNQKNYQGAYPHLVLARKMHPQLRSVHLLLYNDLVRLDKLEEAMAGIDSFLARFPDDPEAPRMRKVRAALEAKLSGQQH